MRSGSFDRGVQVGEWTTYDKARKVYKVTKMKARVKTAPLERRQGIRPQEGRQKVCETCAEVISQTRAHSGRLYGRARSSASRRRRCRPQGHPRRGQIHRRWRQMELALIPHHGMVRHREPALARQRSTDPPPRPPRSGRKRQQTPSPIQRPAEMAGKDRRWRRSARAAA